MTIWLAVGLVSALVYGSTFVVLTLRHRPRWPAVVVGVVHLLLGCIVSVAPFRSFFDPAYPGFAIGLLRFEGRAASLPAALFLIGALACAFIAVRATAATKAFWVIVTFDVLFTLNQALDLALPGRGASRFNIQFGEHLTIAGIWGLLVMATLFVAAPACSAWWAAARARSADVAAS